jgi:hypothetical protein
MGIDEFTIDWHGINGWFVPPVCLVARVLRYMRQCTAQEQLFGFMEIGKSLAKFISYRSRVH